MKILKLFAFTIIAVALTACGGKKSEQETAADQKDGTEIVENADGHKSPLPESTLSNPNFIVKDHLLISENLPIVVDFYADWCPPCKAYTPVFEEVSRKYANSAVFVSINVEEYPEIAKAYGVQSIPTTAFIYAGGALLGTQKGKMDAPQLEEYVNQLIATNAGSNMSI